MKFFFLICLFCIIACTPALPPSTTVRVATRSGHSMKVKKLPLEKYLIGVLASEIPADWPLEAIKAQAVASRSYTLYRKNHPRSEKYDLEASTQDQVFGKKIKNRRLFAQALHETANQVLEENDHIVPAFFHSCCGGFSERGSEVWPEVTDQSVSHSRGDPYCENCPRYHWELPLSLSELNDLVGPGLGNRKPIVGIDIESRNESGRVTSLVLHTEDHKTFHMAAPKFRETIGFTRLLSTLFDITHEDSKLWFRGKGAGHGVGLCQWGAKGMADAGKSYQEILEFYYPGAQLIGRGAIHGAPGRDESRPYEAETEPTEVDPE